jgi:hypothetical protein
LGTHGLREPTKEPVTFLSPCATPVVGLECPLHATVEAGLNVQLLIDAIVRQTTVLIAQLATSGGLRAPLSRVAGQVFLDLAREIEAQGVSRKVSSDMFGLALRSYQRKTQRLRESQTEHGRSLWEAVFDHLGQEQVVTRREVLARFHRDDEALVRGVLHDLTESGLVFASGSGGRTAYRIASEDELGRLRKHEDDGDLDALRWMTIYRQGPLSRGALLERCALRPEALDIALVRLCESARVTQQSAGDDPVYAATEFVVGLGDPVGWEAAVLDHFQALVKTICQKLAQEPTARATDLVGGSTYTFVVWDGHPLAGEVRSQLAGFRQAQSDLRQRVDAYNAQHEIPAQNVRVITYGGQCVIEDGPDNGHAEGSDAHGK